MEKLAHVMIFKTITLIQYIVYIMFRLSYFYWVGCDISWDYIVSFVYIIINVYNHFVSWCQILQTVCKLR